VKGMAKKEINTVTGEEKRRDEWLRRRAVGSKKRCTSIAKKVEVLLRREIYIKKVQVAKIGRNGRRNLCKETPTPTKFILSTYWGTC
jgi:hypothetical protein